jgi:hypothetical protein
MLGQRIAEGSDQWLLRRELFVTVTNVGNRPIGTREAPGGLGAPGAVIGRVVPTRFPAILLTFESANALASSRRDDVMPNVGTDDIGTTSASVLPEGVFALTYRDPEELQGVYVLYLKLERL